MKFKTPFLIMGFFLLIMTFLYSTNLVGVGAASPPPNEIVQTYGPSWEKECMGNDCISTIYSYERYWKESNGEWEPIDESFSDCTSDAVDAPTKYCTNEYYYKAEAEADGTVRVSYEGDSYTMKLAQFNEENISFDIGTNDGAVIYTVIQDVADLRYQYLTDHLKEEVVIYEPQDAFMEDGLSLTFETTGGVDSSLAPAFVCDSNQTCMDIEQIQTENSITLFVPAKFFQLPTLVYPIVVDPTVTFGSSFVSWNGYIRNETNQSGAGTSTYTRFSNPSSLITVGIGGFRPEDVTRYHHGIIEWNLSSIPQGSVIYEAKSQLRVEPTSVSNPTYTVSLFPLDYIHTYYSDQNATCQGNCQFYIDAANGTSQYTTEELTGKSTHNFTLYEPALTDIASSLTSGIFGFGIDTDYSGDLSVGSKDHPTSSKRPTLTIRYGVNNTNASDAIAQGIWASVLGGGASVSSNKQIYVLNEEGDQYLSTFDRYTVSGNQTWVFNYIVPSDEYSPIPSLFRVLNVWQNESLTSQEIIDQVSAFINNTKY